MKTNDIICAILFGLVFVIGKLIQKIRKWWYKDWSDPLEK